MQILQPRGFITTQTPVFKWELVDGVADYNLKVLNNVTSATVIEQTVSGDSYTVSSPLAFGTYSVQVMAGDNIAIETVVVTNVTATYTVSGREGDTKYLAYKQMQQAVRERIKAARFNASSILDANNNIKAYLAQSGDPLLIAFHQNTILQTPGLAADLTELELLATQVVEVISRIQLRDPAF